MQPPSPAFLDIFSPEFTFEGADVARARDEHWYADTPIGPLVLRNREVSDLLTDPRFRLGGEAYMELHDIEGGPLFDWWMSTLMSVPMDTHRRMRGLVTKAFTPRVVENLRPFTRRTAERLAAQFEPGVEHDFVAEFADPLPALVMCELIGVPEEDYPQFHAWAGDIGLAFATGGITPEVRATVEHAIIKLGEYVDGLIQRRRAEPRDDLITAIIQAETEHDRLTTREVHDLVLLLVWAGQDTTARQIGRAMVAFSQYPDQWAAMRADPGLVPRAVGEVLRWTPQVRIIQRFANLDLTYGDREFPADSMVLCCITAANRDPQVFPDPTEFRISRDRPARQLAFGGGPWHCLGHSLAHLELEEAFHVLAARFGAPRVTGPITWRPTLAMIHGPDVLPLTFNAP